MTTLLAIVAHFSFMGIFISFMGPFDYKLLLISILCYYGSEISDDLPSLHQELPSHEKSLGKTLLKFAMWLPLCATMFGTVLLAAQLCSTLAALPLYAVAVAVVVGGHELKLTITRTQNPPMRLLPIVGYASFMKENIDRMGPGDYYMLLVISFLFYLGLNISDYFLSVHRKLPSHEKSLRKILLKIAMWLMPSATMFGVVLLAAPLYSTLAALPLYVVAVGGSVLLFYVHMIHDDGEEKCKTTEKRDVRPLPKKHASFEKWRNVRPLPKKEKRNVRPLPKKYASFEKCNAV